MAAVLNNIKQSIAHVETAAVPKVAKAAETPVEIANAFVNKMQAALLQKDIKAIVALFREDGWWRDILLRTKDIAGHLEQFGVPNITDLKVVQENEAALVPVNDEVTWVSAFLSYETPVARGRGFIRLRESSPGRGDWLAYTFFTTLWEIKGHEEFAYERRPLGTFHGEQAMRTNWLERRQEAIKFQNSDPTVLIVGGGQNGLMLAARLQVLGIPTLIVEKNPRIGDSWRNRYHTLCLHDPVWADHFPYIRYPESWPIYTPKDKIANWMEHYADLMELNVWLESTIDANPTFDETTKKWSVTVQRAGHQPRKMEVSQLVLASGFSGEPRMPNFPQDEYKGTFTHSSRHKGGRGWEGKKAVVVGCCNSGHDIAADLYENGADVTIVQRSSTYVMSSKYGIPGLLNGYYQEGGPPLDSADIMLTSLPIDLLNEYHIEATKQIAEKDKEILDGLKAVGFKLNPYPGGLFIKYFRDGGGYYIDVGASKLIADRKIKIKQGKQITKLTKDGVLFEDGVELKADIVVAATGYASMRTTVARVISEDVAKRMGQCWGADAQGEIPGVWRNSGVDHFYLMCGNMFQARCFSKHVALQIQMQELGLGKSVYPAYKDGNDQRF
ncbi:hypothetical protein MNV49_007614 [Pseudohyphozyma bogoriensis]|nr:hypothetical protein MNV49_007614 [Pseudohyphozyma bogoriensis]